MNACEKKELKAVLQKLSDKLEGKMVGGEKTIVAKAIRPIVSNYMILFSCPYPDADNKTKVVRCSILKNLPGYADLYKDTITNITFSNNLQTILMDPESSTYLKDLVNNVYAIDLTITTSTNKSKTYHMIGSRIDPIHDFSGRGEVGYCVEGTNCYSNVFDPYSSQMVLGWFSQEPKLFPETVSIDFPQK